MARSVLDSQRPRARRRSRSRPALQGRRPLSGAVGSAGERGRLTGRLVIATHNSGKLREFDELLQPFGVSPLGAAALGLEEPEETGSTFQDNALLKARAAARLRGSSRSPTIPGSASRRLTERRAFIRPDGLGRRKTLAPPWPASRANLKRARAPPPWRAAFVSVLALAWPDGAEETFEGRVDGTLVFPPRGTAGFGYDPIFLPDGHERTFGEMSSEEKHGLPADGSLALSHRARAFQKLRARGCERRPKAGAGRAGSTARWA